MVLLIVVPFLVSVVCGQYEWLFDDGISGSQLERGVAPNEPKLSNEWTVQIEGGEELAQLIAVEFGFRYGRKVVGFPDHYVFYQQQHKMKRLISRHNHTEHLVNDIRVKWAEQQNSKTRVKRYYFDSSDIPLLRPKRLEYDENDVSHNTSQNIRSVRTSMFNSETMFNDELWANEWYLQDTRTNKDLPRLDLNVIPVYLMGINGKGIRVSILDDGIEHNHTDLFENYDPEISWDSTDHDPDPMPRYTPDDFNSHGTRCAGEVSMVANNEKCGVGVAWGSKVGGVRLIDGDITDRSEGEAIAYAWDKVDIYSASWGPNDDGRTVDGPGRLAKAAFERGIQSGRGGKGAIYVWANGNGGIHYDNCNCDGYSASIYTVSIGSASQHGDFPWYGEVCTSTLATAYSSGAYKEQKITTSDIRNKCTLHHTGTSAAAPLAAGIIALALSANPNLTWRDVQHLVVWTSDYAPLANNKGWIINGAGLHFDIRFGFGLMNAAALVSAALEWTTVPPKFTCSVQAMPVNKYEATLTTGNAVKIYFKIEDSCLVNYIEHVELRVNIHYNRRGALQVELASPHGTAVEVLTARPKDKSDAGFRDWPLMSVATWGENPKGIWMAVIYDRTAEENRGEVGTLTLTVHGTKETPVHMRAGPRIYSQDYNKYYQEALKYYEENAEKQQYSSNYHTNYVRSGNYNG